MTWIKIKVEDDESGAPIHGLRLTIKKTDNTLVQETTRADGKIDIREMISGSCDVSCDLKGAELANTFARIGMGEKRPDAKDHDRRETQSNKPLQAKSGSCIARVRPHRVRSGETPETIAASAKMTWQDLAQFNWGASSALEVARHLKDQVGCVHPFTDAKQHLFSDNDTPGIIYLPDEWTEQALHTGREYVVRVRPISVVFDYAFELEGDQVHLAFSVRGFQPPKLKVRLYECSSSIKSRRRETMIRVHAEKQGAAPGHRKSGCFCEVQPGEDLDGLAQLYGHSEASTILDHHLNDGLDHETLGEGDEVYIPQVQGTAPVPLGDLLEVQKVDEAVDKGKRYRATWDVESSGYSPLDSEAWLPELDFDLISGTNTSPLTEADEKSLFQPQFAVVTPDLAVIGVSPTPLRLVHKTKLQGKSESQRVQVIFSNGTAREVTAGEGVEEFVAQEEPLWLFGAELADEDADDEQSEG